MIHSLFIFLSLPPVFAGPTKCPVKGEPIRWQFAYCARQVGTDDCESPAIMECASKLMNASKKKSECDQKKDLKSKIDESCKKSGPCPKIPSLVQNGCGEP